MLGCALLAWLDPAQPGAAHDEVSSTKAGHLSAVWANEGGDKVTREELRASGGQAVTNSIWNGTSIRLFGAKNEVVNFNLILEAGAAAASAVTVRMSNLLGPGGSLIRYAPRTPASLFNWTSTEIELFYVRYLPAAGISFGSFAAGSTSFEATWPRRFQCPPPLTAGCAWAQRPGADQHFPEIAVPLELVPTFTIEAKSSQAVWADLYIPKSAVSGTYTGTVTVQEGGATTRTIPVSLVVRGFTLPDVPSAGTMVFTSKGDISLRYTGVRFAAPGSAQDTAAKRALIEEFMLAHRHRISLIDGDNFGYGWAVRRPAPEWLPVLDGTQFTAAHGYAGPGAGVGNGVFSIGAYGHVLDGQTINQANFTAALNGWESWFKQNSPGTERFVYLCDESACTRGNPDLTTYLRWWGAVSGPGAALHTMATQPLGSVVATTLSDPTSVMGFAPAEPSRYQAWAESIHAAEPRRRLFQYNGSRPAAGSTSIEDDGVALRELAWAQYKKGVDRWFIWQSTYYNDYQNGRGDVNVWENPMTFGCKPQQDRSYGLISGCGRSAPVGYGDGMLFYPGTDQVYRTQSYGIDGPIVSLRLKLWRRGLQDVDYLALAKAVNPAAVRALLSKMVPQALWEVPCDDLKDCTYSSTPASWSINPDDWEAARAQLAHLIDGR